MGIEKKIKIKTGDAVYLQGAQPEGIYVIGKGTVEIISVPEGFEPLDEDIIFAKGRRLFTVSSGAVPPFSQGLTAPYTKSARAVTDCEIVQYHCTEEGFKFIVSKDPNATVSILKSLFALIPYTYFEIQKLVDFWKKVAIIFDNLGVLYMELAGRGAAAKFHQFSDKLHSDFISSGGTLTSPINASFLNIDNGKFLKKNYGFAIEQLDPAINKPVVDFASKIVNADSSGAAAIFKGDNSVATQMFDLLSFSTNVLAMRVSAIRDQIDGQLNALLGADSWSTYLVKNGGLGNWMATQRLSVDFVKSYIQVLSALSNDYEKITSLKIRDLLPGIGATEQYYAKVQKSNVMTPQMQGSESIESDEGGMSDSAIASAQGILQNSLRQLFDYANFNKDDRAQFVKGINDLKKSKDPLSNDSEERKTRRLLTKAYWELYKKVYVRSKSDENQPLPVRLMLNYGFIDETLMRPENLVELIEIDNLERYSRYHKSPNILHEHEFLNLIYKEEEPPSVNEMGLTYEAYLREMERSGSRAKREQTSEASDPATEKLFHEINQRSITTASVCSGSTSTALPFLCYFTFKGSLKNILKSRASVEKELSALTDVDFSAFYRETVLKLGDDNAREIIQTEILPYLVLVPAHGTRILMWQEMIGTNKRSRARIFIPIFFMGDFTKSLSYAVACFRWELNRSIKGGMWADPIEGGVTGEYFDYVSTFKKNSKLSQEYKEKLVEKFRSINNNRDRFADDYISWVMFEKEGMMKVNPVVREMFCKHIPFPRETRDRLINMPVFTQYINRYNNVSKRNFLAAERKFKKYQDDNKNYPPEIKAFLDFMLV